MWQTFLSFVAEDAWQVIGILAGGLVLAARECCPLGWQAAWCWSQPQLGPFGLLVSSELAEHLPALLSRQRSGPPGDRLKLGWLYQPTSAK